MRTMKRDSWLSAARDLQDWGKVYNPETSPGERYEVKLAPNVQATRCTNIEWVVYDDLSGSERLREDAQPWNISPKWEDEEESMHIRRKVLGGSQNLQPGWILQLFPCWCQSIKSGRDDCFFKCADLNTKLYEAWRIRELWDNWRNKINLQQSAIKQRWSMNFLKNNSR